MKQSLLILLLLGALTACKNEPSKSITEELNEASEELNLEYIDTIEEQSIAEIKAKLTEEGYQIFDYVDEKTKDTIIMQQYFIAFLKTGPNRDQNEEEANKIQAEHMAHLGKMYDLGYADISGPFDDESDIRGITIYNVPNFAMADSLANADPAVKAGRLVIEVHPWWAAKGFGLR